MRHWFAAAVLLAAPAAAQSDDRATVARQVEAFFAARTAYDGGAIEAMLAPDYQEVSPIGDVDTRAEVMGFYAPDQKKPAPAMTVDEVVVTPAGATATVTARVSFEAGGRTRAIRAGMAARKVGRDWKFTFAQFTPMPPKPAG